YFPADIQPQMVVPFDVDPEDIITLALNASDADAEGIANCLKMGVEHTADGDPDLAMQYADLIITIGERRENGSLIGLGTMAGGDTLAHSGRIHEAWDRLEQAGKIYLEAGNEVGWARTRIGRVFISPELDRSAVVEAFADAQKAEEIFLKAERYDRLLPLY